jgi:PAS domain S-box-containing protein
MHGLDGLDKDQLIQRLREAKQMLEESHSRYADLYDFAPVGYLTLNREGVIGQANLAAATLLGVPRERLSGWPLRRFTVPKSWPLLTRHLQQAHKRPGDSVVTELQITPRGEGPREVRLESRIAACEGHESCCCTMLVDLTERKRVEEDLRKLSRVIEQTASTVLITDPQGVIEYVNPRFTETTGYSAQEAIGQRPSILKSGHTLPSDYRRLWETITHGATWHGEFLNRRRDGSVYWESAIISPVRGESGEITHFVGIKDDITQHKHAEVALRASEEHFRCLFYDAPVPLSLANGGGQILAVNARFERVLGYSRADVPSLAVWWTLAYPDPAYRAQAMAHWDEAVARAHQDDGDIEGGEYRVTCKDGTERIMVISAIPFEDGMFAAFFDITERKRAESALGAQEARYRAVIETAADGFWMMDAQGHLLAVNDAYIRRCGYSREELLGMWIGGLEAARTPAQVHAYLEQIRHKGSDLLETHHRAKDGKVWPVEMSVTYSANAGGLLFAFLRDMSDRRVLEQEVIEASTAEQERIGHDLHDGIGQQLTGLTLLAGSLEGRLASAGHTQEAIAVADLRGHLQATLTEVRALARGLAPVVIDPDGLSDALADLTERVRKTTGLECRFQGARRVRLADGGMAVHLYRIAQEAVQNAVKHAKTSCIEVGLRQEVGGLVLTVRDDGTGIDLEQDRHGRLGLHIMHYRADIIRGRLQIGPAEGGGTLVCCEIPSDGSLAP